MPSDTTENVRERILAVLDDTRTVDCHSHTALSSVYCKNAPYDLFTLKGYFDRDIDPGNRPQSARARLSAEQEDRSVVALPAKGQLVAEIGVEEQVEPAWLLDQLPGQIALDQ